MADLIEALPPTDSTQVQTRVDDEDEDGGDEVEDDVRSGSSAKIDHLLSILERIPDGEKAVVFSQFTSFLDKVRHSHFR